VLATVKHCLTAITLNALSENNIKRVSLSFLKSYYRYRPRKGKSKLQTNMRAAGGVVVDGHLSFSLEDDSEFVATVEATSYMTRDEVRYRPHRELITWDGLAIGLILAAVGLSIAHATGAISIPNMGGWLLWLAGLIVAVFLFQLFYRLLFGNLRRYRYIYAVEQFKRYYADEQWIAIGEDVFSSSEDPFFQELREQCIYNGFGLIIVDLELRCKAHITPSRNDLFKSRRDVLEFFSLEELARRLETSTRKVGEKSGLDRWLPLPRSQDAESKLLRHRPVYWHQMGSCLIAAVLIVALFLREMQEKRVTVIDADDYRNKMSKESENLEEEPMGYLLDSAALRPFEEKTSPYLETDEARSSAGNGFVEPVRRPGLIVYQRRNTFFEYDCERLYDGALPRFVIAVEIFDNATPLKQLIERFNEKGLEAMGLWLGCFTSGDNDYALFLSQLYATEEEAWADLPAWQARIEREGFSTKLEVLGLQRSNY